LYADRMRIAVLADIHGNLPALEAVVRDLRNRRGDLVINLGDCVSGPLWPKETAELLIGLGWPTVRGNHDRWITDRAAAEQYPSDAFALRSLSSEQLAWLRALPSMLKLADCVFACHGRAGDDNAYMLENVVDGRLALASRQEIAERIRTINARVVLCGHSHIDRVVTIDNRVIVNPGSIGLPAYEDPTPPAHVSETGSPHARYAIIELQADRVEVEMIMVSYDHCGAAKRAEENGSAPWAHFLATGFARTGIGA
jgi:predicted phosphodiesterase